tara:strand:- start:2301 stop:2573 length:273 start_codon:yes stop_codon:yes gene_type:complete
MSFQLFSLGQCVLTQGVRSLKYTTEEMLDVLDRHQSGDWGDLDLQDKEQNDFSLQNNQRLLSSYKVADTKIWVITEWDRSSTTILLPDEY